MYSMTGYGKSEYNSKEIDILIEIKTVNNRNLDINCKLPRCFIAFEDIIRKCIQSRINRGRLDVFINMVDKRDKESVLSIDEKISNSYVSIADNLAKKYNIKNDMSVSSLMRFPEVIKESDSFDDMSEFLDAIKNTTIEAADNLNKMRKVEGEKLKSDILSRINVIDEIVEKIKIRAPFVAEEYKQKLTERIKVSLNDVSYDETRLLNEVAFFTDKSNIDEELTRLTSHISQFKTIVENENAGKQLDFLIQEFNREANTICSKANDIEVTNYALSLKCEIEKIREQIQNIE